MARNAETLIKVVNENIAREAKIMTDDAATYYEKLTDFAAHQTVNHSALDEYPKSFDRALKRLAEASPPETVQDRKKSKRQSE